jgi:hypothetical protein
VYFYLEVTDARSELKEREEILLRIMETAQKLRVEFAFPTRTLHISTAAAATAAAPVEFDDVRVPAH